MRTGTETWDWKTVLGITGLIGSVIGLVSVLLQ